MANILLAERPFSSGGSGALTVYNFTVPADGIYFMVVQATGMPPSGLTFVVKDNSTTLFTAPAMSAAAQIGLQFRVSYPLVSGHTYSLTATDSAADGLALNGVQLQVQCGKGM